MLTKILKETETVGRKTRPMVLAILTPGRSVVAGAFCVWWLVTVLASAFLLFWVTLLPSWLVQLCFHPFAHASRWLGEGACMTYPTILATSSRMEVLAYMTLPRCRSLAIPSSWSCRLPVGEMLAIATVKEQKASRVLTHIRLCRLLFSVGTVFSLTTIQSEQYFSASFSQNSASRTGLKEWLLEYLYSVHTQVFIGQGKQRKG